jgi:cytochrome P450
MVAVATRIPQSDINLFADDSLRDPFGDYRRLRDLGPVVRLAHPDVYAISRFDDVRDALRSSDILISGEGVGFSDAFNAPKGNNVIQSDGDLHRRLRAAVMRPLKPETLERARPQFKAMIAERIADLTGRGEFDAMRELATFLPVQAIAHLVGLDANGRERMLEWASATFNAIGPTQDATDLRHLGAARAYMAGLDTTKVREGSWAGQLFDAVRAGNISQEEALGAISAYVIPSLDTTILAKGHLLHNLGRDPKQWDLLQAHPELIPSAVLEGVRHSSVIRWFSRVAAKDYSIGEQSVPAGARVMLLYGSANRDERHYPLPDRFDITRDARDHLAWGRGQHMCAGLYLARMEMEVMLEALVESGAMPHAGVPVVGANKGLYGFTTLPYQLARQT